MHYFLQQFLNGLHAGAIYALLAFGYVVTNGVLHRTNLAYGAIFAFCGQLLIMAAIFAYDILWLDWLAAIGFASLLSLTYAYGIGTVLSRHVLQPLAGKSPNIIVAATLGVAIVLMESSRIAADTRDIWLPPLLSTPIEFAATGTFRVTLTENQIVGLSIALAALVFGAWMIARSRFGRIWRAVSDDPLAAQLCGVDVSAVFSRAVVFGALAACLGGVLAAVHYGNIGFGAGLVYGLKILFVTAAGSYASPILAALGAAAYGIGESLWTGYFPAEWRDGWMFAFLVVLLVLRTPPHD